MADIAGAIVKMNDVEIDADAVVTEALFTKIGANINGLIDENDSQDTTITNNYNSLDSRITTLETPSPEITKSTPQTSFSLTGSEAAITNANLSITVAAGEYVMLWVEPTSYAAPLSIDFGINSVVKLFYRRAASPIAAWYSADIGGGGVTNQPVNSMVYIDTSPGTGSISYDLAGGSTTANSTIKNVVLCAKIIKS